MYENICEFSVKISAYLNLLFIFLNAPDCEELCDVEQILC